MGAFAFVNCAVATISAAVALLVFPLPVSPATGPYTIEGGTARQRAQVRFALAASTFNWHVVPAVVHIRIGPGTETWARSGKIRLGADLLDQGPRSWGVVQHEFAHQVDLLLLDDAARTQLTAALGGKAWWPSHMRPLDHEAYASERFASTLAWAYWPSRRNTLRPRSNDDEAAAMEPAKFRALLAKLLNERSGTRIAKST
jgi:hypothetical protein